MDRGPVGRISAATAALTLVAALSACAAGSHGEQPLGPDDLPGIGVEVSQPRTDIALDRIAIQVRNDGDAPLELARAELDGDPLLAPLVWSGRPVSTIGTGRALDLRVDLGAWNCAATGEEPLTVALELADGRTARLPAGDPTRVIPLLHASGCLDAAVAEVVAIRSAAVESDGVVGHPGVLVLSTEPTGAAGSVRVVSVRSTTLVAPFDGSAGANVLPLEILLGADGPREVRIPLVPNRCDAHALAEDKIGTRIPLDVVVTSPDGDRTEGRIVLPADDAQRAALHGFYSSFCGLTS